MKVARALFWLLLAGALVLFAVANWLPVEVRIGAGLVIETKLPVLVIGAFLLGLAPTWAIHRISLWRLKRQMATLAAEPTAASVSGNPDRPTSREPAFVP